MKVEVLLIGFGLAGLAIAEQLRQAGKSFFLIDCPQLGASQCAAGVYNPTILKRYTMAWEGTTLLEKALPFYKDLEKLLGGSFLHPLNIGRVFSSIAEQNQWMCASDKIQFQPYLTPGLNTNTPKSLRAPFGYGLVRGVGRLAIPELLSRYQKQQLSNTHFLSEEFDYYALNVSQSGIGYKGIQANHIIFCEGAALRSNPFFNWLPLRGVQGDMVCIHAPKMDFTRIWKSRIFVVPQGKDRFWIGASFNNRLQSPLPTEEGKQWVLKHLDRLIQVPYTLLDHQAQLRPSVTDRRPLIGTHPIHHQMHIFNGLGSRGVITAPAMGEYLYKALFENVALPNTISINRFKSYLC